MPKNTYDPKTGVGYDEKGVRYEKFSWEPDANDTGMLNRENAGTGNVLPGNPIPSPIIGGNASTNDKQIAAVDPYATMMDEYKAEQEKLAAAVSSKSEPFEHPDLVSDDASDNEEIL